MFSVYLLCLLYESSAERSTFSSPWVSIQPQLKELVNLPLAPPCYPALSVNISQQHHLSQLSRQKLYLGFKYLFFHKEALLHILSSRFNSLILTDEMDSLWCFTKSKGGES